MWVKTPHRLDEHKMQPFPRIHWTLHTGKYPSKVPGREIDQEANNAILTYSFIAALAAPIGRAGSNRDRPWCRHFLSSWRPFSKGLSTNKTYSTRQEPAIRLWRVLSFAIHWQFLDCDTGYQLPRIQQCTALRRGAGSGESTGNHELALESFPHGCTVLTRHWWPEPPGNFWPGIPPGPLPSHHWLIRSCHHRNSGKRLRYLPTTRWLSVHNYPYCL